MESYEHADLYRDAAFARRLAARLVGESGSEDVWQAAWLVLLERPPRPGSNLRAYLRTVVQRLALRQRRRAQREWASTRDLEHERAAPSTEAIVARMEIHRLVVDALLALDEPYKRTLYLLYFEDRSAAEVARDEGVPLETVRTRAKRGIAKLRERLERVGGSDREWLRGLAALAGLERGVRERAPASPLLGAGITLGLATLAVLGWVTWSARPAGEESGSAELAGAADAAAGRREEPEASARLAVEPEPPGERSAPVPGGPGRRIHGRVSDPAGAPIPGAAVELGIFGNAGGEEAALASTRSDAEGRYAFELTALAPHEARDRNYQVEATAAGYAYASYWTPVVRVGPAGYELDVGLEPGFELQGRVVDESGVPVCGGVVLARTREGGRESSQSISPDSQGVYRFGCPDAVEVLGLEAWNNVTGSGFLGAEDLPPIVAGVLRAPDLVQRARGVLRGRAVYPDGTPARELGVVVRAADLDAAGQFVIAAPAPLSSGGLSRAIAVTDAEGRFAAVGLRPGPWAFEVGSSSMRPDAGRVVPDERIAEEGADVTLLVEAHRFVVAVVGPDGAPVSDVRVAATRLERATDGAWRPRGEPRKTHSHGGSGIAPFFCEPGETLAVEVLLPGWAEQRVLTVPDDSFEVLERVVLPYGLPRGALRLRGVDPGDGRELAEFELRLWTPITRLFVGAWTSDGHGIVRALPCGSFRATVVPLARGRSDDCLVPAELPDPIRIDEEARELTAPLARGGKLAVVFQLEKEREPEDYVHPEILSDWVPWFTARRDVVLRRAEDAPDAPPFLALDGAEPGRRWRSAHALPPGRYRLEARFAGFAPVEEWIELVAGRATEVCVALTTPAATR